MTLQEALKNLAQRRAQLAEMDTALASLKAKMEATPEGKAYGFAASARRVAAEELADAEAQARDLAYAAFTQTGDKKPAPGVSIKWYNRVVYDTKEVMAWCRDNARMFLHEELDKRGFEDMAAKVTQPGMPWKVEGEPRVTLATDLSAYLVEESAPATVAGAEIAEAAGKTA